MSSHHVVRDDQEPALFIVEPHEVPVEVLHELLEWSPVVLTTAKSFVWLRDLGIKTNTIFIQKGQAISSLNAEQDIDVVPGENSNIFKDIFSYLAHRNIKALNIVSDVDKMFLDSLNDVNIKVMIYKDHFKWFQVKDKFKKWVRAKQVFHSYVRSYTTLNGKEMQWSKLDHSYILCSEEEGFLVFENKGSFWLGEQVKS